MKKIYNKTMQKNQNQYKNLTINRLTHIKKIAKKQI